MSLGKLIQKGRNDKGMTQKDLATKICEKPQVINEYEQGKGIPNNQILIKIEKAIGIKLRGKDKGTWLLNPLVQHKFRNATECTEAKEVNPRSPGRLITAEKKLGPSYETLKTWQINFNQLSRTNHHHLQDCNLYSSWW